MLSAWVAPSSVPEFIACTLQRSPVAVAGTARGSIPSFGWETLDGVLRRGPEVRVVAGGEHVAEPPPRNLDELQLLLDRGIGLLVRHAEQSDDGLAELARRFTDELPGECQVQLFVTPPGTHGGWCYEWADLFIAQMLGEKDYLVRENTVELDVPRGGHTDFARAKDEHTPVMTARLNAGDFLYIPVRWWHMAVCREPSLTVSIGAFPAS